MFLEVKKQTTVIFFFVEKPVIKLRQLRWMSLTPGCGKILEGIVTRRVTEDVKLNHSLLSIRKSRRQFNNTSPSLYFGPVLGCWTHRVVLLSSVVDLKKAFYDMDQTVPLLVLCTWDVGRRSSPLVTFLSVRRH